MTQRTGDGHHVGYGSWSGGLSGIASIIMILLKKSCRACSPCTGTVPVASWCVCWLVFASTQCLFLLFPIENSRSGETNKTADIIWDSYSHDLAEKLNLKWIHVCLSENEKFT